MENNKILSSFLRKIATKIENNKIDRETLQKCGEFYIACKSSETISKEITNEQMEKYLLCGFWVYQELERYKNSQQHT